MKSGKHTNNNKVRAKKGGKKKGSIDFLDEDDGGHFGLLQHQLTATDFKNKKWNKVDLGLVVPDGVDENITGIEELDSTDYPVTPKKRKAKVALSEEKIAKKKQKQAEKNKERKKKKKAQNGILPQEKTDEIGVEENNGEAKGDEQATQEERESDNEPTASINIVAQARTGKHTTKHRQVNVELGTYENLQDIDMSAWKEFRLHPKLVEGLQYKQFSCPTDIQKRALPVALAKKDIVAAAETGSGKTLAFGLPILHRDILCEKEANPTEKDTRKGPLAIIISPTRELATQIVDHLTAIAKFVTLKELSVVPIIGGMSLPKQVRLLTYKPDVIVATPGRLWDIYETGNDYINHLDSAKWVVLDEADRLIQGNHFKEMDMLFEKLQMRKTDTPDLKKKRQIFLFSATLIDQNIQIRKPKNDAPTSSITKLFSTIRFQNQVESIDITKKQLTATNLREAKIYCEDADKDYNLYYLLQRYRGKTIVFVNSIHGVKRLTSLLRVLRIVAFPLFSDMEQRMRLKNLDRFKAADRAVLVATDVAARGLDVPNIDHVIHFQVPLNAETYVHRSGRTARASKDGIAVMLISPQDQKQFIKIFTVLKKDTNVVVDFPVDPFFMPAIRKRVDMAHQVELTAHRSKKASTEKQWLIRNLNVTGGELHDFMAESDDEDDKAITARKLKKRAEANINQVQEELNALLDKPLLPIGINRNYVTATHFSTKLLVDPTAFHTSGAIQDLEDTSTKTKSTLESHSKQRRSFKNK